MKKTVTNKVCPSCKGMGWVYYHCPEDLALYVLVPFTLGLSLLMRRKVDCKVCDNTGKITVTTTECE